MKNSDFFEDADGQASIRFEDLNDLKWKNQIPRIR